MPPVPVMHTARSRRRTGAQRRLALLCATVLLAATAAAGESAADGPWQGFLPGDDGEATAWLVAGPYPQGGAPALPADATPRAGAPAPDGKTWRLVTSGSAAVDLTFLLQPRDAAPPADPDAGDEAPGPAAADGDDGHEGDDADDAPARGEFLLYTTIRCPHAQNGYAFLVANGPCRLAVGAVEREAAFSAEHAQYVATVRAPYAKGRTPLRGRLTARDGMAVFTVLVGAFRNDRPEYLRGSVVEAPAAPSDAGIAAWLDERVELSSRPSLLRKGRVTLRLHWRRGAPLPRAGLAGAIRLQTAGGETLLEQTIPPGLTPAMLRRGVRFERDLAELPETGHFLLRAAFRNGAEPFGRIERRLYSRGAVAHAADRWTERLDAAEAGAGRPFPAARLEVLRLRRLGEDPLVGYGDGDRIRASLERIERLHEARRAGRDPFAGRTGRVEAAYVSPVDGSYQPYRLYIPERPAAGDAGMPLTVLYHGYVPGYTRTSWMRIDPATAAALEEAGMAMLLPFGRSNTDFLSVGEVDVFDALAEVRKRYPVDPDRIYLAGYSMGGSGVWTTLTHYPGVFAAARIWSGRTDYYTWHDLRPDRLPGWLRLGIETDNPLHLAENLAGVPVRVTHPLGDRLVKPAHSARMARRLEALGLGGQLRLHQPEGGSHWDFGDGLVRAQTWRDLLRHRRTDAPVLIRHVTHSPKYGRNRWLRIERIRRWGRRAGATVRLDPGANRIRVEAAENADRLAFRIAGLRAAGLTPGDAAVLLPDGETAVPLPAADGDGWAAIRMDGDDPADRTGPEKTPSCCGPVKEAFNAPFLLVQGTRADEATLDILTETADRFAGEWCAFAKGRPRRKDDVDVTPADMAACNLVCIGSPRTNAVLAGLADRLPFGFEGGYAVGDAHVPRAGRERLGFVACYPNPEAPDRLVVVMDGLYYGDHLPINHKWDLVPDYLVFTAEEGPLGTNRARLAGHFDSDWRVDPGLRHHTPAPAAEEDAPARPAPGADAPEPSPPPVGAPAHP